MREIYETERLVRRLFEIGDLNDVYRSIFSDINVCKYYCNKTFSLEETREWLTYRILEPKYSQFHAWAVVRKEDNLFLGFVRLEAYVNLAPWGRFKENPNPRYNNVEVELSFAFGKEYWGKGYATEACKPAIEYAFRELKIPRLIGGAHFENPRSANLQRRLGYRVEEDANNKRYITILENNIV